MKSYTKPDMERPIDDIRAEIKRDYETLAKVLQLSNALDFDAAVVATRAGMTPHDAYPYKEFQQAFAETVAKHAANDDAFTDAFEILTGVWNHFPHDDLGMSPIERMRVEVAEGKEKIDYEAMQEDEFSPERQERIAEAVDVRLGFLSEVAESYLNEHLGRVQCTEADAQAIITILTDPQRDPGNALVYILTDMIQARTKRVSVAQRTITMENIQPLVRVVAMCENHVVSVMENGHKNSRMMQAIAEQCMAQMAATLARDKGKRAEMVEIIEPITPIDCLLDTHAQISRIAKELGIPEGLEEAAHHILDWFGLTDMREIITRPADEMAALTLAAARLIAATGDPAHPFDELTQKLRSATHTITDDTAYDVEVTRLARKALCSCNDPILMMPNPGQEPDDCEERLIAFAPDIKLRSPISPDDLPILSPFS